MGRTKAKKCLACQGTGKDLGSVSYLMAFHKLTRDNPDLVGVKDLVISRVDKLIGVARGMSAAFQVAYLRGKQEGEGIKGEE